MTYFNALVFLAIWALVLTPFILLGQRAFHQFPLF